MARQLTFDLPVRPALGRDDFFVSPANEAALAAVESPTAWPSGKLLLLGARGAGKTHLAHVHAEASGAQIVTASDLETEAIEPLVGARDLVIEDVHQIAGHRTSEEALFHLHNLSLAEGGRILFTATGPVESWGLALADLKSRLMGSMAVRLHPPDDALLTMVLMKLFADRQLSVPANLLPFLLSRMGRSFQEAHAMVQTLDQAALAEGRAVTRALAAKVLDKHKPEDT